MNAVAPYTFSLLFLLASSPPAPDHGMLLPILKVGLLSSVSSLGTPSQIRPEMCLDGDFYLVMFSVKIRHHATAISSHPQP